jgi:small-conductance mechanosensitive channel
MNWDSLDNFDLLNRSISVSRLGIISVRTVILLLLISVVLIGLFYLLRRYIVPYLGSRKAVRKARTVTYRIEVITWLLFTIFALYQLLSDSLYITSVILIILILGGRNYWRDLIAGVIFRLENKFKKGDPVSFENYKGIIDRINQRNIVIRTDKQELVMVPFRKVSNAIFVKRQAKGKLHSAQLNLPLGAKTADDIMPQIHGWIFQCPWTVMNENVSVKLIGPSLIQVSVYAVDKASIDKTEEFLLAKIRK